MMVGHKINNKNKAKQNINKTKTQTEINELKIDL